MFKKWSIQILIPVLFTIIAALSVPASGADNAVITGDGVRMRYFPSVSGVSFEIRLLDSGTRVEVLEKTDFTDTINGYTAPWYRVKHGKDTGYVFGRYVGLDAGITVGRIEPGSERYFTIQVFRFVETGLDMFGTNDSEIIGRLGQPLYITEYEGCGIFEGNRYYRLTYEGISFEMAGPTGEGSVWGITCTSGSYEFGGLRVGSPVSDVKRLLGDPTPTEEICIIRLPYCTEEGAIEYPDRIEGELLWYRAAIPTARFRIVSGKVTKIAIFDDWPD